MEKSQTQDPVFPEHAWLANPILPDHRMKMRFIRRMDLFGEGPVLSTVTRGGVCEAVYLKGVQVSCRGLGKTPQAETVTVSLDGICVIDEAPAKMFVKPCSRLDFSRPLKSDSGVFLAKESERGLGKTGLFLTYGTKLEVRVKSKRKLEIRVFMAEYTTRMGQA